MHLFLVSCDQINIGFSFLQQTELRAFALVWLRAPYLTLVEKIGLLYRDTASFLKETTALGRRKHEKLVDYAAHPVMWLCLVI